MLLELEFEEMQNSCGQFGYRVKNERPNFPKAVVIFWKAVYCIGEIILGICFVMCAPFNTDGVDYCINRWEAINDWFLNKNCST